MRKTPVKKMSDKKLATLDGKRPFSSITSPRTPIANGGKPIPKVNPGKLAKRIKTRRKNHAAYRASETFRVVEQRAAGRCEASISYRREIVDGNVVPVLDVIREDMAWMAQAGYVRCANTEDLEHHHVRYPKIAGNESPDDVLVCCERCHHWIERVYYPSRRHGR